MITTNEKALANLRHVYHQLVTIEIKDQKSFAKGLIAPVIKHLESQGNNQSENQEMKAYLRTLANFGGTLQQSKELAQKCLNKLGE